MITVRFFREEEQGGDICLPDYSFHPACTGIDMPWILCELRRLRIPYTVKDDK